MKPKALFYRDDRFNQVGALTEIAAGRQMGVKILNGGYTGVKPKRTKYVYLPVHPWSYEAYDISLRMRSVSADGKFTQSGGYLHTGIYTGSLPDVPPISNLYNRALSDLNEKTRGSLDLSIDLAEAGQTTRMFRLVDQVVDHARRFRGRYGPLGVAANMWLQYTYGVKPLLSSIHGVVDEMERFVLNKTARFRVKTSESVPVGRYGVNAPSNLTAYITVPGLRMKRTVTLGIVLDQRDSDPSRWTSMNPASIAWELMPYSFVIDWFLDVGGYLRNLETSILYANRFKSGYRTDLTAVSTPVNIFLPDPGSTSLTYTGKIDRVTLDRTVLTTYPAPRLPTFQARLGSSRLISAAALLTQLLKR